MTHLMASVLFAFCGTFQVLRPQLVLLGQNWYLDFASVAAILDFVKNTFLAIVASILPKNL